MGSRRLRHIQSPPRSPAPAAAGTQKRRRAAPGLAVRQGHDGTGIGVEHLGKGMRFQQVVDQLVEIEAVEETIAAETQRSDPGTPPG